MSHFKLGSKGVEVRRIQARLQTTGFYRGPVDGDYGGATAAAVRQFQSAERLVVDGVVGPVTWEALFAEPAVIPNVHHCTLDYRCLALTGAFETSTAIPDCFAGLSGDFDGQGLSFGVLQWNIGQGTLQPLLQRFCTDHGELARSIFFDRFEQLSGMLAASREDQLVIARAIQDPIRKTVREPWRGMFKAMGRTDEFIHIEISAAKALYAAAGQLSADFGLWSERGVALMFDITTQNGSINAALKARILADFASLPSEMAAVESETARLRIIANRRAEAAKKNWVEDVRARKLCIANGKGSVHGVSYDLESQFGIGLRPV